MYIASNVDIPIFKYCEHFHLFLQTYKDLLKTNEKEGPSVLIQMAPLFHLFLINPYTFAKKDESVHNT